MKWLLPATLTIAVAIWLARRNAHAQASEWGGEGFTSEPDAYDQATTLWEDIAVSINPMTYIPASVPQDVAQRNERAFLDMIAYAEGTNGPHGYATAFGGGLLPSLADHPRTFASFTNKLGVVQRTSAAGRYQFLMRTWDELQKKLNLPDFGPDSQDAAALELIRQRGALQDVRAGRTSEAIAKCAPTWASLPGAGYNQQERKLSSLVAQFRAAGGIEATA
jgi:muramidase (phage lysozyme)